MRTGSREPGNLGKTSRRVAGLLLPLLALSALGLHSALAEATDGPQASPASLMAEPPAPSAEALEALARREQALEGIASPLASRKAPAPKRKPAQNKPVKVFHTRATWYGGRFQGRRTASGERFDRHAHTLASRHLPFGTRVRVVNVKNGKSAVGRVNDRGPFKKGHGVDLSQALARRIGLMASGPVRVEILPK